MNMYKTNWWLPKVGDRMKVGKMGKVVKKIKGRTLIFFRGKFCFIGKDI